MVPSPLYSRMEYSKMISDEERRKRADRYWKHKMLSYTEKLRLIAEKYDGKKDEDTLD